MKKVLLIVALVILGSGCEAQLTLESKPTAYEFEEVHSELWGNNKISVLRHKRTRTCFVFVAVVFNTAGPVSITQTSYDVCDQRPDTAESER